MGKEYGERTSFLRRSGNQKLILQHVSFRGVMLFSRVDRENPYDVLIQGLTIAPRKDKSLLTTILDTLFRPLDSYRNIQDELLAYLVMTADEESSSKVLVDKWIKLFITNIPASVGAERESCVFFLKEE